MKALTAFGVLACVLVPVFCDAAEAAQEDCPTDAISSLRCPRTEQQLDPITDKDDSYVGILSDGGGIYDKDFLRVQCEGASYYIHILWDFPLDSSLVGETPSLIVRFDKNTPLTNPSKKVVLQGLRTSESVVFRNKKGSTTTFSLRGMNQALNGLKCLGGSDARQREGG